MCDTVPTVFNSFVYVLVNITLNPMSAAKKTFSTKSGLEVTCKQSSNPFL